MPMWPLVGDRKNVSRRNICTSKARYLVNNDDEMKSVCCVTISVLAYVCASVLVFEWTLEQFFTL